MKRLLFLPLSFLVAAMLLAAPAAFAANQTTQPASNCKPYADSATKGTSTVASGIYNVSKKSLNIICPLVRMNLAENSTDVIVAGFSGTKTAVCTLYSIDTNGIHMGQVGNNIPSNTHFNITLSLPLAQTAADTSQVVVCTMPPQGGITAAFYAM